MNAVGGTPQQHPLLSMPAAPCFTPLVESGPFLEAVGCTCQLRCRLLVAPAVVPAATLPPRAEADASCSSRSSSGLHHC